MGLFLDLSVVVMNRFTLVPTSESSDVKSIFVVSTERNPLPGEDSLSNEENSVIGSLNRFRDFVT